MATPQSKALPFFLFDNWYPKMSQTAGEKSLPPGKLMMLDLALGLVWSLISVQDCILSILTDA